MTHHRPAGGRRAAVAALAGLLTACGGGGEDPDAATAAPRAGARIEAGEMALISRDAGEAARGGLSPLTLPPGETGVWDGRWEITAGAEPLTVVALKGQASSLSAQQRARLARLPGAVRPSLPLIQRQGAAPCSPTLAGPDVAAEGGGRARLLVLGRYGAAVGLCDKESVTRCHVRGASAREPLS